MYVLVDKQYEFSHNPAGSACGLKSFRGSDLYYDTQQLTSETSIGQY